MRRRECFTLLAGAASWPIAAWAQQSKTPVIGFLHGGTPSNFSTQVIAFREGLRSAGYVEGQNISIEYRWAEGHFDKLPAIAADLVHRNVAVIVAFGGEPIARAAVNATATIPVVFFIGQDPVKSGLVASLNRPAGNATGVTMFVTALVPKQMELIHTIVHDLAVMAVLYNPDNPANYPDPADMEGAARANGVELILAKAAVENEIDTAFATMAERKVGALVVPGDVFLSSHRQKIVALAERHRIPAIYGFREYVDAGGLMSYGNNLDENARLVAGYVVRILHGEKPGNLPVEQPTKFEFVINLKAARSLGLTVSNSMQLLADEVIE
jgi:putative tryptophan/tyrosine transport system substrate-binding protein